MFGGHVDYLHVLGGFVIFLTFDVLLQHDHAAHEHAAHEHAAHEHAAHEHEHAAHDHSAPSPPPSSSAQLCHFTADDPSDLYEITSTGGGWVQLTSVPGGVERSARMKALTLVTNDAPNPPATSTIPAAALLSILGDLLHNFTDGLTLGLTASTPLSLPTFFSILLHELPHELGDFAVLLSHGYSRNQAIQTQFATATAAFIGTTVGLYLPSYTTFDFLPIIAGTFLYLGAVSLLPAALAEKNTTRTMQAGVVVAFVVGVAVMWALTQMEGGCTHGHDHGHHDHQEHHDHHDHVEHSHEHQEEHQHVQQQEEVYYDEHAAHDHDCEHEMSTMSMSTTSIK